VTIRFDHEARTLRLSARDLAESGSPSGHLIRDAARSNHARMRAGQIAHVRWQTRRAEEDARYEAESRLEHTVVLNGWTITLHGRADGVVRSPEDTLVEEIKSTALDASRLSETRLEDFPDWVAQLELYLWLLHAQQAPAPRGQLVLVSLADSSHHIFLVPLDVSRVWDWMLERLERLIREEEAREAWMRARRAWQVPTPFGLWRPGQEGIADGLRKTLSQGIRTLVQAPTGLGKTAAILFGTLETAFLRRKQVFWATSRNTQKPQVQRTVTRFRERGIDDIRSVILSSRDASCLNHVVACRPDTCKYAENYYDKMAEHRVLDEVTQGDLDLERARAVGETYQVCPHQLTMEASSHADVVIGDYNYAFSPSTRLKRHFADRASEWFVVADEAHQLVDRARGYTSPTLSLQAIQAARAVFNEDRQTFGAFLDLTWELEDLLDKSLNAVRPPLKDGMAVTEIDPAPWKSMAERLDQVGLDYALLRANAPLPEGTRDPWIDVVRQVHGLANVAQEAGPETVGIGGVEPGRESIGLLCRDPSPWLGPYLATLGGFVGASATLMPTQFYRSLLGLPGDTRTLIAENPFPAEHRDVLIASGVSTAYKDRRRERDAIVNAIQAVCDETPGNVAVYFPSFAWLRQISPHLKKTGRRVLAQRPGMGEEERLAWLAKLEDGVPSVLVAALGGVFAEGLDLPAGALSAVVVAGPALPPVGLERDLLREWYEEKHGAGFLYASLVPGMTRVVQAAGRLIRRHDDKGVIVLLGRRFRWRDYAELLPEDWEPESSADLKTSVHDFWKRA